MADSDLLEFLLELDKSDIRVTPWETEFLDSVLGRNQVTFTPKQRDSILRMMDKYDRRLGGGGRIK